MSETPRWKYRFDNFERAYLLLQEVLDKKDPNLFERAGLIQIFEVTFELAWKTLSDRLKHEGINDVATPRQVIRQAFRAGVIDDGQVWIDMLDDRNRMSHRYDLQDFEDAENNIRRSYRPALQTFRNRFAQDAFNS